MYEYKILHTLSALSAKGARSTKDSSKIIIASFKVVESIIVIRENL